MNKKFILLIQFLILTSYTEIGFFEELKSSKSLFQLIGTGIGAWAVPAGMLKLIEWQMGKEVVDRSLTKKNLIELKRSMDFKDFNNLINAKDFEKISAVLAKLRGVVVPKGDSLIPVFNVGIISNGENIYLFDSTGNQNIFIGEHARYKEIYDHELRKINVEFEKIIEDLSNIEGLDEQDKELIQNVLKNRNKYSADGSHDAFPIGQIQTNELTECIEYVKEQEEDSFVKKTKHLNSEKVLIRALLLLKNKKNIANQITKNKGRFLKNISKEFALLSASCSMFSIIEAALSGVKSDNYKSIFVTTMASLLLSLLFANTRE